MICLRAEQSLLLDEESVESDNLLEEGARSKAPIPAFVKKHFSKTTTARSGACVMRETTYCGVRREHKHVLHAGYCEERNMAILGGAICRMPVSSPVRQELHSCKFWPAWTGIKAETSAVALIFIYLFIYFFFLWWPFLLMVGWMW